MIISFELDKQTIKRTDSERVVSGSVDYIEAEFVDVSGDWKSPVTALFDGYAVNLDDDMKCVVPWEAMQKSGVMPVSAFCGNLHTANNEYVSVEKSGYTEGVSPRPPSPDVYHQLINSVNEAVEVANGVKEDADAGKFDGKAATVTVESTETLPAGSQATVENVGDENDARLAFGIPQGQKGDHGDPFTFDDFTPEQIEELQKPAIDAAAIANTAASSANESAEKAEASATAADQAAVRADNAAQTALASIGNVLHQEVTSGLVSVHDAWGAPPLGAAVYGNTRQNLWKNPSGTNNGVTVTSNEDGSMTVSGTSTSVSTVAADTYALKPGETYTMSLDVAPDFNTFGFYVQSYNGTANKTLFRIASDSHSLSKTFNVPDDSILCRCGVQVGVTTPVSKTYRVMLREATASEIAAAQQTASTLQEGGTADIPQDYPVTLPAYPIADSGEFDWCPPGITSVTSVTLNVAGKNLAYSESIEFRASVNNSGYGGEYRVQKLIKQDLAPGEYVFSYSSFSSPDGGLQELGVYFVDAMDKLHYVFSNPAKFSSETPVKEVNAYVQNVDGKTYTIKNAQIEVGSTATEYEQPNVTQYPIDLHGNELRGQGDWRDVLDLKTGVLTKKAGYIASYSGEELTGEWTSTMGKLSEGATVVYQLDNAETVQLDPVAFEALPAHVLNAWAETNIPTDIALDYQQDINIVIADIKAAVAANALNIATK